MKKIGIMSMQRIYNYGSFLQGYGLKRLIEELDKDINVEFVDYVPGIPLVETTESKNKILRKLKKLKEYNEVNSSFINKVKFFNHKRTYAKRFYPELGINEENNIPRKLDLLVIGSDEVFNCVQSNTNVGYTRDLFGHNVDARAVISYAGSFGNTTLKKINDYGIRSELIEDFSKFKAVSVRDMNSFEIVKELGVKSPVLNIDPALAYNYMEKEEKIPSERLCKEKYIIVYGYSGRLTFKENKVIKEYAKDRNLKILCFGGVQDCCDEFIDCSPFELLAYFRDAEAIITDTFHGTIFSIINNKKFVTIIRKSKGMSYGNEEKLGFLLDMFKLESQKLYNLDRDSLMKILNNEIDYTIIQNELEVKRNQSIEYLKQSIL